MLDLADLHKRKKFEAKFTKFKNNEKQQQVLDLGCMTGKNLRAKLF